MISMLSTIPPGISTKFPHFKKISLTIAPPIAPRRRRQSQHSEIAKAVLSSRSAAKIMAGTMLPPPLDETITCIRQSSSHKKHENIPDDNRLAPPKTSLGRALQTAAMGNHATLNGIPRALNDTPLPSAPSTAPGSPRL